MKKRTVFQVKDHETLRAISDPMRIQIVELLAENLTVKQVAEKLGLAPSKLYYHFNTLEKLGVIEVTETRMVANMVEKIYRANAEALDVDPNLLRFNKGEANEPLTMAITSIIDTTRDDLLRSLEARKFQLEQGVDEHPRGILIDRIISRISEERAKEFTERLVTLLKEFENEPEVSSQKTSMQPYALTMAFYPSYYFDTQKETEE